VVLKPYGDGPLVHRALDEHAKAKLLNRLDALPGVEVDRATALDAEKIALGAFTPLQGFMNPEDYESVLRRETLRNGLPWTIPIIFAPRASKGVDAAVRLQEGNEAVLFYKGRPIAVLYVESRFAFDKRDYALRVYGTLDGGHPDVRKLVEMPDVLVGGRVDLLERVTAPSMSSSTGGELTPAETRGVFEERGWETVAAYQTRNPPHLAHEYLQRCALEIVDGLLIHPVVGELKEDDFPPEAVVEAYEYLIRHYYPPNRVLMATLSIAMRYAGPKAAVLLAIVRRNYGCTHFIVGRDMAGVGGYYDPYGAHDLLKRLDLGIEPILFRESFFCRRCERYATEKTCGHVLEDHLNVSMTQIRKMISLGQRPPPEVMRPEIAEILMKYGRTLANNLKG